MKDVVIVTVREGFPNEDDPYYIDHRTLNLKVFANLREATAYFNGLCEYYDRVYIRDGHDPETGSPCFRAGDSILAVSMEFSHVFESAVEAAFAGAPRCDEDA